MSVRKLQRYLREHIEAAAVVREAAFAHEIPAFRDRHHRGTHSLPPC